MKQNMGKIDKYIRGLIAVAIIILYSANVITGTLGIIVLIVGVVLLLTAIIGVCPAYIPLGLSTKKKE
jgi:hypothetical protein